MIKNQDKINLTILGATKDNTKKINQNNVKVFEIENNENNIIKFYDDHNIFILPSYTEGHPMVLLESLARLRPVIVFKEIKHVIGDYEGIFISQRNTEELIKNINHIHISENDRGTPGKGNVPWAETFEAIKNSGYDGWLTIEAFGRALPDLAAATRVWRDFFPSKEEVYEEGYKFIKTNIS